MKELLEIRRAQAKALKLTDDLIKIEGHKAAATLAEVWCVVGDSIFRTKDVFENLPREIEIHGPSQFPYLSSMNTRELGQALNSIHKIGAVGGFEVTRLPSHQNRIVWMLTPQ